MTVNTTELNAVVREMVNASAENYNTRNGFNQQCADIVRAGIDAKLQRQFSTNNTMVQDSIEKKSVL